MATSPGPEPTPAEAVGGLCRLVYDFRLIAVVLTIVSLPGRAEGATPLVVALLVATVVSFVPLKWWHRLGPTLMRHPAYLAADTLLAAGVLAVAGVDSPFFYFTLGTALLAGLLYEWRGAVLFSVLLVAAAWWAYGLRQPLLDRPDEFHHLVGAPALYPIFAAAGLAVRRLLERQTRTAVLLADAARRSAAAEERARLAREMHDSLAKTLHGISLSATALAQAAVRRPESAEAGARALARSASTAAAEARSLIVDLRADAAAEPLCDSVRGLADGWSTETGVAVASHCDPVEVASASRRHELLSILGEALANVARHASATSVDIALVASGGRLLLSVVDDGAGFRLPANLGDLAAGGHFGLIGMNERAARAGGRLSVTSEPGHGTVLVVAMPAAGPGPVPAPGGARSRRAGAAP